MEACRIAIVEKAPNIFDVGAPMKHKELCYEMLADAQRVIDATTDEHFTNKQNCLTLVMDMSGRVDVAAPLPHREKCKIMLLAANDIIERFDDDSAPALRPFDARVMGGE
jgi:hypothetical protein